jgi:SagB-type dehydrogenase family enzyme
MEKLSILLLFLVMLAVASAQAPVVIKLNEPDLQSGKLLMQALKERQSSAGFTDREIPLQEISNLLWAAFGINRPENGKRTAPSGSNRQEIEIYTFSKQGIYHYNAGKHELELVKEGDYRNLTGRGEAANAALNLLFIADTEKTGPGDDATKANTVSYVNVGYISQNVYLYCASAGIGTRARGGWDSTKLSQIMNLKKSMVVVLGQTVGYTNENQ